MSRRDGAIVAAALALAWAGGAAAREPGAIFYRCNVQHRFALPGAFGGPIRVASGPSGRIRTVEQAESNELIDAGIEVEEHGRTANLSLAWVQDGFFWSPELSWRADLHPVFMQIRFGGAVFWAPRQFERFDPAEMEIELTVASQRRIKHPVILSLYRPDERRGLLTLGGGADLRYAGQRSASVRVLWRDLAAFANGRDQLSVDLSEASRALPRVTGPNVARGTLDLAVMPRLIAHFRAAEAEIRALVPDAAARCERQIEPEVPEDAAI